MTQVRGDWELFAQALKVPQWNEGIQMCWLCNASNTRRELAWIDTSAEAAWRDTLLTHEAYVQRVAEGTRRPSVLLDKVIGLRIENVMVDVLHCVDQGIASNILASALWELVQAKVWARTQVESVSVLDDLLEAWYKRTRATCRIQGKLTVERLCASPSWASLKAKAAATRHLAPFVLELMVEHDTGTVHDRRRRIIVQLLVRFYEILGGEERFSTAVSELPTLGQQLANLYSSLAEEAAATNKRIWKMYQKLHMFQHLCEHQVYNIDVRISLP